MNSVMQMARVAPEKTVFLTRPATRFFSQALQEKQMSNYFEKLRDPRWQRKRLEAMELHGFECEICYDQESTLNVHHKAYIKGREPWEYEVDQLSVLCQSCHAAQHSFVDEIKIISSFLPIDGPCNKFEITDLVLDYIRNEYPDLYLKIAKAIEESGGSDA